MLTNRMFDLFNGGGELTKTYLWQEIPYYQIERMSYPLSEWARNLLLDKLLELDYHYFSLATLLDIINDIRSVRTKGELLIFWSTLANHVIKTIYQDGLNYQPSRNY